MLFVIPAVNTTTAAIITSSKYMVRFYIHQFLILYFMLKQQKIHDQVCYEVDHVSLPCPSLPNFKSSNGFDLTPMIYETCSCR